MNIHVEKIDHENATVRKRLFDFLAPHESYCLFITGNMKVNFPDSHIYVASRGNEWVGAAGYYGIPRSVTPFAFEPEAARALARHVAEHHPAIQYLCAISSVAEPACDELCEMSYELTADPRCVFMKLDALPPRQPLEELARLTKPGDYEDVARLHRYLHNVSQDSPVTEEELRLVGMNPLCHVLVLDDKAVSTAATNGIGLSAFQIIGVATSPELRNKGYGRTVCASLIRTMWAAGARQCVLFTEINNLAAQSCYRKLGFRMHGEYWMAKLGKKS